MRTRILVCLVVFVTLSGALGGRAVEPPATNSVYESREGSRDGIGKFHCGREIARVMGHEAADWLERTERETEENTTLLVDALRFKPGEIVADIGAGTGYVTRRIARKVSPGGCVYAVDIQPEMLEQLTNRLAGIGITNVTPVLGIQRDPRLPAAGVDTVLMVDVYHECNRPAKPLCPQQRWTAWIVSEG
jgi:tRNA A58 N-methylase Trm61